MKADSPELKENTAPIDQTVLTAREQAFILGSSHPDNQRMVDEPNIPQAILDGRSVREVRQIRRDIGEIISASAAFHFGIEDLREVILSVPDLDEVTSNPISLPQLVGIYGESEEDESKRICRDPDELSRYRLTLEAQARFVLGKELSSSGMER